MWEICLCVWVMCVYFCVCMFLYVSVCFCVSVCVTVCAVSLWVSLCVLCVCGCLCVRGSLWVSFSLRVKPDHMRIGFSQIYFGLLPGVIQHCVCQQDSNRASPHGFSI